MIKNYMIRKTTKIELMKEKVLKVKMNVHIENLLIDYFWGIHANLLFKIC